MCQHSTASLRAVATTAICIPRRARTRSIERAQRARGLDRDPGGLDEHPARVRAALLGDPSVRRGLVAGLLDARVQAEVADELVRRAEAGEVADGGGDRHRDGRRRRRGSSSAAWSSSQPSATRASSASISRSSWPWKSSWRSSAQTAWRSSAGSSCSASQRRPLIPNRSAAGQRGTRLRCRIAWTWFFSRVRWRTICARRATWRRAPASPRRRPTPRQVVGGQQLREHLGVDLVGLDLRLGDRPRLLRVGRPPPARPGPASSLHDRVRVAGRLQRDLVARRQAVGEDPQRLRRRRDLPGLADQAVLPDRDLRELAMHIESDSTCASCPHLHLDGRIGEAAGGQDDTYGFALEAHPGKSQGRPPTNTGSKPIEQERPARPRLLPDAPVPDGRTVLTAPDALGVPRRSLGTGGICRLSYRIPTRLRGRWARSNAARRSWADSPAKTAA